MSIMKIKLSLYPNNAFYSLCLRKEKFFAKENKKKLLYYRYEKQEGGKNGT